MSIVGFLKALFGGKKEPDAATQKYLEYQKQTLEGGLTSSAKLVCVVTLSAELKHFLADHVKPALEKAGYQYDDNPNADAAAKAAALILDGTPAADARLHGRYDKILRVKKSMGKIHDLYCIMGHRQDYKRYPRGIYPNCLYFCMTDGDLTHRDKDLPPEGRETVEGPRLFNLADAAEALLRKLAEERAATQPAPNEDIAFQQPI
jgi:hypothetical protein